MTDNLIHIDARQLTGRRILLSLLINACVNTLIAVILFAIGFGHGLVANFIFSQCIGMSIYLANLAVVPFFRYATRLYHQILFIVAAVIVGAGFGTILGAVANGMNPAVFIRENAAFFGQVLLIGLVFGVIISYIFISFGKITEEKMKRLEAEKFAVETELKLLQSQMEPHFLFNTLSNVLSLIDSDRDKARRMLESFTSFLRSSYLTARHRTVTLAQEMEVVRNYLRVFHVRMGDRLRYEIDMPDDVRDVPVPPLLIQPLVENAIKHGLEPAPEGGAIGIRMVCDGGVARIFVTDTGIGVKETGPGAGIGLANIRKRLDLAYGGRARLLFEENKPRGVKVTIEIPCT
jgi:sensor histidine kinase YesM